MSATGDNGRSPATEIVANITPNASTFAVGTCRNWRQICDSLENLKAQTMFSRNVVVPVGVGVALAIAVLAPMTGGWLLLLDNISGPHPDLPRSLYGLDSGIAQALPLALFALNAVFGSASSWLPFAIFFPLASVGVYRAMPGSVFGKVAAALFFSLTPFVFERLWVGQSGVLLGYALLPYVFHSMHRAFKNGGVQWTRVALWIALSIAMSPHYLWISLVLLAGMFVTRKPQKRNFFGVAAALALIVLMSSYLLANASSENRSLTVDSRDLVAYATQEQSDRPLIWTVATLQGFWRSHDPQQPANTFQGRPIILGVGALLIGVGLWNLRRDEWSLRGLFAGGVVALLLSMGTKGPTGSLFQFAFDHLPGFAIMREPQKFVALWALLLAIAFGMGINRLFSERRARFTLMVAVCAVLLIPLSLSPGIFWGFGNKVQAIDYPDSWKAADSMMGNGDGKVLALPWHQYSMFDFTSGRNIANPIPKVLQRETIVGDNVELPSVETSSNSSMSQYLEFLFSEGQRVRTFGALVAPMDVKYIFLAKAVDWQKYSWLQRQNDLRLVFDSSEVSVFENSKWSPEVSATSSPMYVADWGELVGYANERGDVSGMLVRNATPGAVRPSAIRDSEANLRSVQVDRSSPTRYSLDALEAGETVVIAEPFNAGWRRDSVTQSAYGTLMISGPHSGAISFKPWKLRALLFVLSLITSLTVAVALTVHYVRRAIERKRPLLSH